MATLTKIIIIVALVLFVNSSLVPSDAPSTAPTQPPSMAPTTPPTMMPTPLCPNLGIYIYDTIVPFDKADFEANYAYVGVNPDTRYPVFQNPQSPNDQNLTKIGSPQNGSWVIQGKGTGSLTWGPSDTRYPPYDQPTFPWIHNEFEGQFGIFIKCVLTWAPVAAPSNAPSTAPTSAPSPGPTAEPLTRHHCTSHDDCPAEQPFCGTFDWTPQCYECHECWYCYDGIDGTCGNCGDGYPTRLSVASCANGISCSSHDDCPAEQQFCSADLFGDTVCSPCDNCYDCSYSIDGTCGHCGPGYPTCVNETFGTGGGVRLMGGTSPNQGRVEVFYKGIWGTVCDDSFDDVDAEVVCRQLGYDYGTASPHATFGEGTGRIWLDEVNCAGTEASITQCGNVGWGWHDCSHWEDVGVSCGTVINCTRHDECPINQPFCSAALDGACDACDACMYCVDGIDGTCGSNCGTEYPLYEQPCMYTVSNASRDCDTFAIDDFLSECSLAWASNQADISTLYSSLSRLSAEVADVEAILTHEIAVVNYSVSEFSQYTVQTDNVLNYTRNQINDIYGRVYDLNIAVDVLNRSIQEMNENVMNTITNEIDTVNTTIQTATTSIDTKFTNEIAAINGNIQGLQNVQNGFATAQSAHGSGMLDAYAVTAETGFLSANTKDVIILCLLVVNILTIVAGVIVFVNKGRPKYQMVSGQSTTDDNDCM